MVHNKICVIDGCSKIPYYNHKQKSQAEYCSEHKMDDMINVRTKRCQKEGCQRINPSYNYINKKQGLYCKEHAVVGMINKHNKCRKKKCNRIATSNYLNESEAIFCSRHRLHGMKNLRDSKCRLCDRECNYNKPDAKRPKYCHLHKKTNMIFIGSAGNNVAQTTKNQQEAQVEEEAQEDVSRYFV